MGWLKNLIGARWFLPALIGSIGVAVVVFGWGYMRGYDTAEDKYLVEMNKAMKAQYEQLAKKWQTRMTLAVREAERTHNVRRRISEIRVPDACIIPDACLHAFNDGVLATGAYTPRAEGDP